MRLIEMLADFRPFSTIHSNFEHLEGEIFELGLPKVIYRYGIRIFGLEYYWRAWYRLKKESRKMMAISRSVLLAIRTQF